jgi:hypothetical protein
MRSLRSLAPACFVAGLLLGVFALDNASANGATPALRWLPAVWSCRVDLIRGTARCPEPRLTLRFSPSVACDINRVALASHHEWQHGRRKPRRLHRMQLRVWRVSHSLGAVLGQRLPIH